MEAILPELPEVECLTRAVARVLDGRRITAARFFRADLRDPIPTEAFQGLIVGETIEQTFRRSKYMLVKTSAGYAVFHLGMTGNILCYDSPTPQHPHTHAVFTVEGAEAKRYLHFVDPRRFGRIFCVEGERYEDHPFLKDLGHEPLEARALGRHLFEASRGSKQAIKTFIMDARVVVGVGNIYASESLFKARIRPTRPAGKVPREAYDELAAAIKKTLRASIAAGGTTFRDYKAADGSPGYYKVRLQVYDRTGEPCGNCGSAVRERRLGGRSTFFCATCQK
jgi:formamidopyrimidine-DNA glycosylase